MKLLFFISILFESMSLSAQPKIKMELTEYDYGQIIQGANGTREFVFTNTGDSVLLINRIRTGDGGSMAYQKTRRPIQPGESGIIIFKYNTKRLGPFRKTISIRSNAHLSSHFIGLRIKGEVIHPPTTISVKESVLDIGAIPYGTLSSVTFSFQNTGDKKLHIYSAFSDYNYVEGDIFSQRVFAENEITPIQDRYHREFEAGEKISGRVTIRNIYGNTGYFERRLPYHYNSHDTLWVTIKGTFTGEPNSNIIYEKHDALYYESGKLRKRVTYGSQEAIVRIDYFERSNCVKSERFDGRTGKINQVRYYSNGVETSKQFFNVDE